MNHGLRGYGIGHPRNPWFIWFDAGLKNFFAKALKLILAIDGSSDSAAAVEAIMRRTWPKGTEVRMITAIDLPLLGRLPLHEPCDHDEPEAIFRHRAEAVVEELREVGLSGEVVISVGDWNHVL